MTTDIRSGLEIMLQPGSVAELRILDAQIGPTYTANLTGYFDDLDLMAASAEEWSGKSVGVYATLNPVNRDLLARANNHVARSRKGSATTDAEIVKRMRFGIDFDPVRPSGISSSDDEHKRALERAGQCARYLKEIN